MDSVSGALDVVAAIRRAHYEDIKLQFEAADLCTKATESLVQAGETYNAFTVDQRWRIERDVNSIANVLHKTLELCRRADDASFVSRLASGPSQELATLAIGLDGAISSIHATMACIQLEVTFDDRAVLAELKRQLDLTFGSLLRDRDRNINLLGLKAKTRGELTEMSTSTTRTLSGTASPVDGLDRLYLGQKLSLLAEALASISCSDGTVLDVETYPRCPLFGHPSTQVDTKEHTEDYTLKTLGLLESLGRYTSLDELADQLKAVSIGIVQDFEMHEVGLAIIAFELGLRRRIVNYADNKRSQLRLAGCLVSLATTNSRLGNIDPSVPLFKEADSILRNVVKGEKSNEAIDVRQLFALNLYFWGATIPHIGCFTEGVAHLQEAVAECRKIATQGGAFIEPQLHQCIEETVSAFDNLGRFDECSSMLQDIKESALKKTCLGSGSRDFPVQNARLLAAIARTLPSSKTLEMASRVEEILAIISVYDSTYHRRLKSDVWYQLSEAYYHAGDLCKALNAIRTAISLNDQNSPPLPMLQTDHTRRAIQLSRLLFHGGKYVKCRQTLDEAITWCEGLLPSHRWIISAPLADALELSVLLRAYETPTQKREVRKGGDSQLDRAVKLWRTLMDEMPVRATKGLERLEKLQGKPKVRSEWKLKNWRRRVGLGWAQV